MSIEIGGVEVLSLEEVSKRLNVAPEALKRCMRRGELVARKIGDQWFVTSQNLLAFLQTPAPKRSKSAKDESKGAEPKPSPDERHGQEPTAPLSAIPIEELVPVRPVQVSKPETILPHELPPGAGTPEVAAAPASAPVPPPPAVDRFAVPGELPMSQRPTEPLLESIKDAPPPSELATEITIPAVPFPPREDPNPPPQNPADEVSVESINPEPPPEPEPKPKSPSDEKPGEALAALFEMPLLPPEQPVLSTFTPPPGPGPATPPPADSKEDRHAMAIAATQRRAMAKGVVAEPPAPAAPGAQSPRRSLLDSEEMPAVVIDQPGSSRAPDTRPIVQTAAPPPSAPGFARLSEVPGMFGPNSATVLLTPEQVVADAERVKKHLFEVVEQGRIAQRARDEIVATVRQLPLEEQSFALAGPVGEQLVKLDKIIEDGVRAQKELGLPAAPAPPNVVTAVHRAPQEESKWVPIGGPEKPEPMPLIAPSSTEGKKAPSRVAPAGIGGETWHEVGLPSPSGSTPSSGKDGNGSVVRLTLALSDEEKRVLSDHRIAEEVAVQEIMRRYQPTDERGWTDAKGRYFQPLRAKSHSK